jgi:hypothetical protein
VLALACATSISLSAHRRDEHLQAARIGVELDHIFVELDVTPGVDVADALVATIDTDHDGVLSPAERDVYARHAMAGLAIAIDDQGHPLQLVSERFSDVASMRRGEGTIRLQGRAAITDQETGRHRLRFVNHHALARSAYLANALVPDSARLLVTAQHRSVDQRELTIDYSVTDQGRSAWLAPLVVSAAAALVAAPLGRRLLARRGRSRPRGTPAGE